MTILRGYLNNFSTTLDGSILDSDTSIDVIDATGISTALSTSDYVLLTIDDGVNIEVVKVTGVSTNTLTIVRAQEGTAAEGFASGVTIECRLTKGTFDSGFDVVSQVTLSGSETEVKFEGLSAGIYEIDFADVGCNNGGSPPELMLTVGTGGTPTYASSSYRYSVLKNADNSGTLTINNPGVTTYIPMIDQYWDDNAAFNACGKITTGNIGTGKYKTFNFEFVQTRTGAGALSISFRGVGAWNDTTVVTALKVALSGGTFRSGGVITLLKRRY